MAFLEITPPFAIVRIVRARVHLNGLEPAKSGYLRHAADTTNSNRVSNGVT